MEHSFTKVQFWLTTLALYFGTFTSGITDCIKSVTLSDMKSYFDADYNIYATLLSVSLIGYVVASILASYGVTHFGFKKMLLFAVLLCLVGTLSSAFINSFELGIFTHFISMSGIGIIDIVVASLSSAIFLQNTGAYMSIMGFFYGVGATVGPFIAGWVENLFPEYHFRGVYVCISVLQLILICCIAFIPFAVTYPHKPDDNDNDNDNDNNNNINTSLVSSTENSTSSNSLKDFLILFQHLKDPIIWLFSLTLGWMMMVDRAALSWSCTYFQDYLHLDPLVEGALFNTIYYALYTISRLFGGFIADWIGFYNTLYISCTITLILYIVGFSTYIVGIWIICATGFFISLFYIIFLCVVMRYYKEDAPIALSLISPLESLFLAIATYPLGWINDLIGNEWAFRSTILFNILSIIFLIWCHCLQVKKDKKESELLKNNTVV